MGSRRQARELALQSLYLCDTCGFDIEAALKTVLDDTISESVRIFCKHLVEGTFPRIKEIDEILKRYTENWDIQRMAIIDRNILRLAAFEILIDTETPVSVIIDEAIEIAKSFSTQDSGKFVNGILDKVKQERKIPDSKQSSD
jgi:transcription antitermination protein NusB